MAKLQECRNRFRIGAHCQIFRHVEGEVGDGELKFKVNKASPVRAVAKEGELQRVAAAGIQNGGGYGRGLGNIVDLSGENVALNISNSQNITFLNMAKLNVTDVNQFVLSQSTAIFDSILSSFEASSTASLTSIATMQNNSNLIDSILGAPKQTDNINNTIMLNTSVQTAFDSEKNAVYQNIANNSTVRNFAQNFMVRLQQTFNLNISNVSATQNLSVFVNNDQAINSTFDIVTQLDLSTATFNTINLSDTFKIDKSVTAATQAVATASTSKTNSSESVGSAIKSVGDAAGSAIKSVGDAAASLVSSATLAVAGPILAGISVLAIGGWAAYYFLRKNKSGEKAAGEETGWLDSLLGDL